MSTTREPSPFEVKRVENPGMLRLGRLMNSIPRVPSSCAFRATLSGEFGLPQASWAAEMSVSPPVNCEPMPGTLPLMFGTSTKCSPFASRAEPTMSSTFRFIRSAALSVGDTCMTLPRLIEPTAADAPRMLPSALTAAEFVEPGLLDSTSIRAWMRLE